MARLGETRRGVRWLLALCLVASVAACGDDEDTAGTPGLRLVNQPIANGTATTDYPDAVLIQMGAAVGAWTSACSGALIAPRVVLTAGHCVAGFRAFGIHVPSTGARATATRSWTMYSSAGDTVNPATLDVALVLLDAPLALPSYSPISSMHVPDGTTAVNVGRVQNRVVSGTASMPVDTLYVGRPINLTDAPGYPYSYASEQITEPGDSGGPVYATIDGRRTIVAVCSGGGGGRQIMGRVDMAFDAIQRLIADNGGPGSSAPPGDPDAGAMTPPPTMTPPPPSSGGGLCAACSTASDCGAGNYCLRNGAGETFCGQDCSGGCPTGAICVRLTTTISQCVPQTLSCRGYTPPGGSTPPPPTSDAGTPPPPSSDAGSSTPPPASSGMTAEQSHWLDLINRARAVGRTCAEPGRSGFFPAAAALAWSPELATSAQAHSDWMVAHGCFDHQCAGEPDPWTRMRTAGFTFSTAGENIAAGQTTPEDVVNAWLSDYGHCANIMNASFTYVGMALARGGAYGYYWTQDLAAH